MNSTKKLPWLYLILAYGFAWLCWIPVALTGIDYQTSPWLVFIVLLGAFGPFPGRHHPHLCWGRPGTPQGFLAADRGFPAHPPDLVCSDPADVACAASSWQFC